MQIEQPSEGRTTIEVAWYFAPTGAKVYRGINAFTSGIWDRDKPALPPDLGEQPPYAGTRYNGTNVWGYIGQCTVGTPDQFANGVTAAYLALPPHALPNCCQPQRGLAGLLLGGGQQSTQGKFVGGGIKLGAGTFYDPEQPQGAGIKLGGGAPELDELSARAGIKLGAGTFYDPERPQGAGIKLGAGQVEFSPLGFLLSCKATWRIVYTGSAVGGGIKLGGGATEGALGGGIKLGGGVTELSPFGFVLSCFATWFVSYTGAAHGAGILLGGGGGLDSEQPQGAGIRLGGGVSEPSGCGVLLGGGVTGDTGEAHMGIKLGGGEFAAYNLGYKIGCRATWVVM